MKIVITMMFLMFAVPSMSSTTVNVQVKDVSVYLCEYAFNAFNVPACAERFENCIKTVMSQRIYFPDQSESKRFMRAIEYCSNE